MGWGSQAVSRVILEQYPPDYLSTDSGEESTILEAITLGTTERPCQLSTWIPEHAMSVFANFLEGKSIKLEELKKYCFVLFRFSHMHDFQIKRELEVWVARNHKWEETCIVSDWLMLQQMNCRHALQSAACFMMEPRIRRQICINGQLQLLENVERECLFQFILHVMQG